MGPQSKNNAASDECAVDRYKPSLPHCYILQHLRLPVQAEH